MKLVKNNTTSKMILANNTVQRNNTFNRQMKSSLQAPLEPSYQPEAVESDWYELWEPYFCGHVGGPKFVMLLPPPNVTGVLHIGHALTHSIQDAIVRFQRMRGCETIWIPGTDHAGIATQVVVEKELRRTQDIGRQDIGRTQFVSEVQSWVARHGKCILEQTKRIGSSLAWDRTFFTLDETRNKAVTEAFVRLHRDGLIYRESRLINWCCTLQTCLSTIEVNRVNIPPDTKRLVPGETRPVRFGILTHFDYVTETGRRLTVATTRPETLLGDVAIAVHPEDQRYIDVHGHRVVHPFNGRLLPIILDAKLVDSAFGTGVVKITPAHDQDDYDTALRHNLPIIEVFGLDGRVKLDGFCKGRTRFETRYEVCKKLTELGLLIKHEPYAHTLSICSRTGDVIEPMLRPQWWIKMDTMATNTSMDVSDRNINIQPASYVPVWHRWLGDIRDWCVSRQLWWGHRIPAYYITSKNTKSEDTDRWIVATSYVEALGIARTRFPLEDIQESDLLQDEDVLDTWFSSALLPISTAGWPDQLDPAIFPGAMLETGSDILFFWVARMAMLGKQLTGQVPFKNVLLHNLVRDSQGRKMSKSLGNVIDPLHILDGVSLYTMQAALDNSNLDRREVDTAKKQLKREYPHGIKACGADALRLTLLSYTAQSTDIHLDINRLVASRQWCNKVWNAVRFVLAKLGDNYYPQRPDNMSEVCLWMITQLHKAVNEATAAMEANQPGKAVAIVRKFWHDCFCDIFIEIAKTYNNDASVYWTLWHTAETGLRLLHPFMPYVTEELWQRFPQKKTETTTLLMMAQWPEDITLKDFQYPDIERLLETAVLLRSRRPLGKTKPTATITCNGDLVEILAKYQSQLATLARYETVTILPGSNFEIQFDQE